MDLTGGVAGNTTVSNYSGAMFVVGGSGVTFALSAVQDLVLAGDRSRAKIIDVIWSITDPGLSFVHLCVLADSELLSQLHWKISSLSSLHLYLKVVPLDFGSQYSILVLLPLYLKDLYSHRASPSLLGVRRLRRYWTDLSRP